MSGQSQSTSLKWGGSDFNAATVGDDVFDASVELVISWDPRDRRAYVSKYSIEIDGEWFAAIDCVRHHWQEQRPDPVLTISRSHRIWRLTANTAPALGVLDLLAPGFPTLIEKAFLKGYPFSGEDLKRLLSEFGTAEESDPDVDPDIDMAFLEDAEADDFESSQGYDNDEEHHDMAVLEDAEDDYFESSQGYDNDEGHHPAWSGPIEPCPDFESLLKDDISIREFRIRHTDWHDEFRVFLYRRPSGVIGCIAGQHMAVGDMTEEDVIEAWCRDHLVPWGGEEPPLCYAAVNTPDAMPDFVRNMNPRFLILKEDVHDSDHEHGIEFTDEQDADHSFLNSLLTRLIVLPGRILQKKLAEFRFLGPLRHTVPRNYAAPRTPESSRWAGGLGAWDALIDGSDELIAQVSNWLSDPDKLASGYGIRRRKLISLESSDPVFRSPEPQDGGLRDTPPQQRGTTGQTHQSPIMRWLPKKETRGILDTSSYPVTFDVMLVNDAGLLVHPHEVGIGLSQILPVVVGAQLGDNRLQAIEQPELHVHPGLQAAMGDLFIEASKRNRHTFIIETHSEHMILRLLRRIRETEKGTAPPDRQLRTHELGIYYLKQDEGCTTASRIDVDVKGEFIQPWPDDFFEIDFFERFPDAR